jgi:hypothetical protein
MANRELVVVMQVQKVVKGKVVGLTNTKRQILDHEYEGLQRFLQGDPSVELYSANNQQAKRFYKTVKPEREYPLSIRKDLIRVERRDTKIARYWVRIPVKLRRAGYESPSSLTARSPPTSKSASPSCSGATANTSLISPSSAKLS